MDELDEIAEKAGGYVAYPPAPTKHMIHINYRKLSDYCKRKKIKPMDLTLREFDKFVVPGPDEQT